jgi:hypothetical protein
LHCQTVKLLNRHTVRLVIRSQPANLAGGFFGGAGGVEGHEAGENSGVRQIGRPAVGIEDGGIKIVFAVDERSTLLFSVCFPHWLEAIFQFFIPSESHIFLIFLFPLILKTLHVFLGSSFEGRIVGASMFLCL